MKGNNTETSLSRFLSLVLRHDPAAAHIRLDKNGWAEVTDLLAGMERAGRKVDMEGLERIVRNDDKQRLLQLGSHKNPRQSRPFHSCGCRVKVDDAPGHAISWHSHPFLEQH